MGAKVADVLFYGAMTSSAYRTFLESNWEELLLYNKTTTVKPIKQFKKCLSLKRGFSQSVLALN